MKSSRFSLEAQKRPFLSPIQKSGSYPTYAHKTDCRATWSKCGDTAQILSAEGKVAVPEKINPFGLASIAAGIPPAALLVGQKPEPTLIGIEKRRMIT